MITYNNIKEQTKNYILEQFLGARDSITFDDILSIDEYLSEALSEIDINQGFQVVYAHEAWEIIGSNDFGTTDEIDFSYCSDAFECVMKQAKAEIQDCLNEAHQEAVEDLENAFKSMLTMVAKEHETDTLLIRLTYGDSFGWFAHSRETRTGACIYDWGDIDAHVWAIELPLGAGYHANITVRN